MRLFTISQYSKTQRSHDQIDQNATSPSRLPYTRVANAHTIAHESAHHGAHGQRQSPTVRALGRLFRARPVHGVTRDGRAVHAVSPVRLRGGAAETE